MYRGYTKRWRKRWEKEYHKDRLLWVLMDYFIDHANYKDSEVFFKNVGLIPVKRGEHIFGTRKLAQFMGVDRQRIRTKLKILEKMEFLTLKVTHLYSIANIINYDTYNPQDDKANPLTNQELTQLKPSPNPDLTTDKEYKKDKECKNVNNDVKYIVEYLNQKTEKNFKWTSKETQRLIQARINAGFVADDFFTVIDNQCAKWLTDPKMIDYLRPQTLFGTKFESYLQSKPHPLHGKASQTTIKNLQVINDWSPNNG